MTTAIGRTGTATIDLPQGWEAGPERAEYELLVFAPAPTESFGPTVVVTVNPFSGSIAEFMALTVEGITQGTADPYIVDIRPWNGPTNASGSTEAEGGATTGSGRAIMYSQLSPSLGLSLYTTEHLYIEDGRAVQVTTTATVQQWQFMGPLLHHLAASVHLTGTASDTNPAEVAPIPKEAVDRLATDAFGVAVEKIDGLAQDQPFDFDGVWVHGRSLEVLTELSDGLKLGRLTKAAYAEQLKELEALDLVSGQQLTELGQRVGEHLSDPRASYRITGVDSDGEAWFQAWANGPTALLFVEPGYHRRATGQPADRPSSEHFNLQLVPLTMLSTLMARWVGLQPAWALSLEPNPVPLDDIAEGWTGRRTPPAGSNAPMRAFWDEPWFSWTLTCTGVESEPEDIAYFNAGRVGQQRLFNEGDSATFAPTTSDFVFQQLEDRIQATIFGREPVVP